MLERTVGCREPGSLRRLLPGAQRTLKSCRALHAGFWHNNALELELSPLYSTLLHGSSTHDRDHDTRHSPSAVIHSGFHLDFLYPSGTLGFLRQYMGLGFDKQDGQRTKLPPGRAGRRLYTSSTVGATAAYTLGDNTAAEEVLAKDTTEGTTRANITFSDGTSASSAVASGEEPRASIKRRKPISFRAKTDCDTDPLKFEQAWEQYLQLGELERETERRNVLKYLSPSPRIVDAERKLEIFELLGPASRNTDVNATAVRSYLTLRNLTDAMKIYTDSLHSYNYPAGASDIMAYMLQNSLYAQAINFWIGYKSVQDQFPQLSYNIYRTAENLPGLVHSAVELAKYVNARSRTFSNPSKSSEFASEFITGALVNSASDSDRRQFDDLLDAFRIWDTDLTARYNALLDKLLELKDTRFAVSCYRSARKTRDIKFRRSTLHNMLVVFCQSHSVIGIQEIMDDFFQFYKHPTGFAYRRSMAEFASQGDSETVHALFKQHLARSTARDGGLKRASDMAPILHVHARRGELAEVIKNFTEIQTVYSLEPDLLCWNILIDAHGKVQDCDGAFAVFEHLVEFGEPLADGHTFGTIMGICSTRGDFERVVEIYRLSLSMNIEPTSSMVDCLVQAHIQNDKLEEAEKICENALDMQLKGSRTRMWNYLLLAHGMRRNITKVNALLQRMAKARLEYDHYTYSALMQALAMVGQPGRAQLILNRVMPQAGIKPTNFHYATLMGAYLANGNFREIYKLREKMARRDINDSASTKLLSLKATDHELFRSGTHGERADRAFEIFQEIVSSMDQKEVSAAANKGMHRGPRHVAYSTMIYGYVISVLSETGRSDTADHLYQEFIKTLPESERALPPIHTLSAAMRAKYEMGDFKMVEELWGLAESKAKEQGAPVRSLKVSIRPDASPRDKFNLGSFSERSHKIVPSHQLDLTRCLTVYMKSLAAAGKSASITAVVEALFNDGFLLDNKNWNEYIQILAQNHHFKLAFTLCERNLMDNWQGWAIIRWQRPERNRLSIEERHRKKMPLYLRPNSHTLLYLARAFLDLQEMADESKEARDVFFHVLDYCPKVVNAIKTLQRTDSSLERDILRAA